jgi:phage baseplate assembly protein W
MNQPRYRAWRFVHPDLDLPGEATGLQVSPRGAIQMVEDNQAVRQSLLLLLTTRPGERVMRPDYGCQLHRLAFSANDDTTAGLAIHYVRQAIETWEPRVEVLRLDAGANPARPEILEVNLEYLVRATQHIDQLALSMNLAGEEE